MIEIPDIDAAADVCQQLALEAVDFDAAGDQRAAGARPVGSTGEGRQVGTD